MLSFSERGKPVNQEFSGKRQFQYFVISNDTPSQNPPRLPSATHKNIVRTMNDKKFKTKNQKPNSLSKTHSQQFSHNVTQPKLFDQKLKRGQLAAEQRRIRNEVIKMQKQSNGEYYNLPPKIQKEVVVSQNNRIGNIQKKKIQKAEDEIGHLQHLIEKQKKQKIKNDKQFEQKERALELQRQKLRLIENQIRKASNPNYLPAQNSMNIINTKNQASSYDKQSLMPKKSQEHYIDGEEERTRKQKQLQRLMGRRQQLQRYDNPLKYTPTLIPLLSKASYKIISTHISSITQLLIDDILLEQVLILQQIQDKQRDMRHQQKQVRMLEDYMSQVQDLARQNDMIQNRIGNYDKLNLIQWHHKPKPSYQIQSFQNYQQYDTFTMYLPNQLKTSIYQNKDKFFKFAKYRDEYDSKNEAMFKKATQEIIQQMVNALVKQLEDGSSQFVEVIFKHEFK